MIKPVEEVVACVVDYGTFISVADKLGETMQKVYYYSPCETEYQSIRNCIKGTGLPHAERLDDFLDPDIFESIDLFVFPDISFGSLQRHLRSLGKAVWGHMGATDLELQRDFFLNVLEQVGLPVINYERIVGLTALAEYLKKNDDKWVKVNRFRGNMETWKHHDYAHSERMLDSLAVIFGGAKERVIFIVQDTISSELEIGYDGWCIDGLFPPYSFQGYEKKNELYLGSVLSNEGLPDEIKQVNEALAPVLRSYGYRGWWATEIRVDGEPYFIDPTPRMPGQTAEHQLESISNLPDVIWYGAHGIVIDPQFNWTFAAEATLHYNLKTKDPWVLNEWKTLDFPPEVLRWLKLYHYCILNNVYHFATDNSDEVGVVLGVGNSTEEAIDHLKENLDMLEGLPIEAETSGFADLVDQIRQAEKKGLVFGGPIPKPEQMYRKLA